VGRLLAAVQSDGAAVHISTYTSQVLDEAALRRESPADVWGIPTGFTDFDHITGGLQPSEILYISGEPGMGKSILAAQMGFQMAENGYPGAIYSLEMPGKQVVRRRFSFLSKIQMRAIKTGKMTDEEYSRLLDSASRYDQLPIYMSDSVMWTTASLRADLARLKAQYGVTWFVLDYAYLLQDGRNLSENDRTGLISAYLKAICRSLNLAGIVIHSLNKDGMSGSDRGKTVPTGQNLRGSGQQFYDTDLLLFLVRSEQTNSITCVFGKGRELDNPRQAFELHKFTEYPALANAVGYMVNQNGKVLR
jgi:replicative DNA helicase